MQIYYYEQTTYNYVLALHCIASTKLPTVSFTVAPRIKRALHQPNDTQNQLVRKYETVRMKQESDQPVLRPIFDPWHTPKKFSKNWTKWGQIMQINFWEDPNPTQPAHDCPLRPENGPPSTPLASWPQLAQQILRNNDFPLY